MQKKSNVCNVLMNCQFNIIWIRFQRRTGSGFPRTNQYSKSGDEVINNRRNTTETQTFLNPNATVIRRSRGGAELTSAKKCWCGAEVITHDTKCVPRLCECASSEGRPTLQHSDFTQVNSKYLLDCLTHCFWYCCFINQGAQ